MDKSVGPNGRIGYQAVANSKRHPLSVAEQAGLAKRAWQNGVGKTGLQRAGGCCGGRHVCLTH